MLVNQVAGSIGSRRFLFLSSIYNVVIWFTHFHCNDGLWFRSSSKRAKDMYYSRRSSNDLMFGPKSSGFLSQILLGTSKNESFIWLVVDWNPFPLKNMGPFIRPFVACVQSSLSIQSLTLIPDPVIATQRSRCCGEWCLPLTHQSNVIITYFFDLS